MPLIMGISDRVYCLETGARHRRRAARRRAQRPRRHRQLPRHRRARHRPQRRDPRGDRRDDRPRRRSLDAGGGRTVHGKSGAPRRGRAAAHRPRHLRRRRRAPGDAPRLLRAQPVRPGPDRSASTPSAALALDGRPRRVHRRRPQPRRPRALVHDDRQGRPRHAAPAARRGRGALRRRPGRPRRRRRPLHRRGRRRPRRGRLRAARRRSSTTSPAQEADELVHEAYERQRRRSAAAAATATTLAAAFDGGRARRRARRSTSRPTPRCRWRPAGWSSSGRAASSRSGPPPRRPTRCGCSASRLLGLAEHRIRVIMRDTGGGVRPEGRARSARTCASCSRPGRCRRALKWIEDRRENLMSAGQARHEHAARAHGVRRRRRRSWPPASTTCRTSAPTRRRGRSAPPPPSGCSSPGPYRVPKATWAHDVRVLQHAGPHRLPGAVAVRDGGPRGAARHRRPADRHRPRRAAAPQPAAPRRAAVRQPQRHALRPTCRRARRSSRRSSMLDYDAFRREQAAARAEGRYLGVGTCSYVEPTATGMALLRHRGRDDPHRAVGQGQRVPGRRLGGQQPGDDGGAAHRRRARRRHRRRAHRSRATPRSRRSARGTGGSRSGSMIAGAIARDGGDAARADRRHRRAPARGGARRHRAGRRPGHGPRARRRSVVTLAEIADHRLLRPGTLPPGRAAGPRGERPLPGRGADDLGQRHPRVHLRGRHRRPARSRCCATSSARTAGR